MGNPHPNIYFENKIYEGSTTKRFWVTICNCK
jgi:hypothetical protein